jgi:hypothetical protein
VGVLLRDLHTAKLASFPGLRFWLRLDEAFERREWLSIFLGQENPPVQSSRFNVQGSRFKVQGSKFELTPKP